MNRSYLFGIIANFTAVGLLALLIGAPVYFAKNFAKVAGVKSTSKFLVVSQVENFPNLKLTQQEDKYQISFTKQGPAQAYLGVLVINNPTATSQTYNLLVSTGSAKLFFGQDVSNQLTKIAVPANVSVPISLFSSQEATAESQSVELKITADSE